MMFTVFWMGSEKSPAETINIEEVLSQMTIEDNPSYLNFSGEEGIVEYREGIFIGYRYYDKKAREV